MEDEQPRQLHWLLAGLLTAFAGTLGGVLGMVTAWSWLYVLPSIAGAHQLMSWLGFVVYVLAIAMVPLGTTLGGWVAGLYIDRFEKRTATSQFRDERAGGVITLVIKAMAWISLALLVIVAILIMNRR